MNNLNIENIYKYSKLYDEVAQSSCLKEKEVFYLSMFDEKWEAELVQNNEKGLIGKSFFGCNIKTAGSGAICCNL